MSLAAIRRLAEERLGLDAGSLGTTVFESAIKSRHRATGAPTYCSYFELLQRDPQEFQALTEFLVVGETWFYRGGGLFEFLARRAETKIGTGQTFRALCLPCSSGEEPYSLAIALLEANLPTNWEIDAVDVSPRAIAAARRAEYRDFAFRQCPAWVRERHFRATATGWELSRDVRERVRFRIGNVLDAPTDPTRYDLILCRNLLIYLTVDARRRAIDNLLRQLAADGLIGVGHAEASVFANRPFESVGPGEYCLYGHASDAVQPVQRVDPPIPIPLQKAPAPVFPKPPQVEAPTVEPPSLARAQQLADSGQLAAAAVECAGVISNAGPSAEAYALLGIIHQANGETEPAADAFRRALYLDPHHAGALAHAMLLSEAAGRPEQAASFRSRLARTGGPP